MEYNIRLDAPYLGIPVSPEQPYELLEIFCGEVKLYEFQVPVCEDKKLCEVQAPVCEDRKLCEFQMPVCSEAGKEDYYSYLNMNAWISRTITIKGNFPDTFRNEIRLCKAPAQEPVVRPLLHFTAERGWLNDPNGLVYQDGWYHLFFQHNPMDTRWQNMSWGHAVSRDLLHFEYLEPVLYPDQYGTVYSGCGLANERGLLGLPSDALLFYYTAAGGNNMWSSGRKFTQRIAVSRDGGRTLEKWPQEALGVIGEDSRDPKVFWHEDTEAYIMVLWLSGNEFGFFRSADLQNWECASRAKLEGGFECPDLFRLRCGEKAVWVFICADGSYYLGQFDGYIFHTDGVRKRAYLNELPYAAQTYSGTEDRVISVPWLRTKNFGKPYTGMMGLPKELGLTDTHGELCLTMRPVREYENTKKEYQSFVWGEDGFDAELTEEAATEISLTQLSGRHFCIRFFGQELTVTDCEILYRGTRTVLPETLQDLRILIDRDVLEFSGNGGMQNAWYETEYDLLQGQIRIEGGTGMGVIYTWKP